MTKNQLIKAISVSKNNYMYVSKSFKSSNSFLNTHIANERRMVFTNKIITDCTPNSTLFAISFTSCAESSLLSLSRRDRWGVWLKLKDGIWVLSQSVPMHESISKFQEKKTSTVQFSMIPQRIENRMNNKCVERTQVQNVTEEDQMPTAALEFDWIRTDTFICCIHTTFSLVVIQNDIWFLLFCWVVEACLLVQCWENIHNLILFRHVWDQKDPTITVIVPGLNRCAKLSTLMSCQVTWNLAPVCPQSSNKRQFLRKQFVDANLVDQANLVDATTLYNLLT